MSKLRKLKIDKENKIVVKYSGSFKPLFEYVEYINYPIYSNISYIDITNRNDTISFLPKDRIERLSIWKKYWGNKKKSSFLLVGKWIQGQCTNKIEVIKRVSRKRRIACWTAWTAWTAWKASYK